jgi:hypothetical protein
MIEPPDYAPPPERPPAENQIQRFTILGTILLCTLISGLLADSLLSAWRIEIGAPTPRGWRWLLGSSVQTFTTETIALLFGILLLGFALGGVWFLITASIRWLRRQWFTRLA